MPPLLLFQARPRPAPAPCSSSACVVEGPKPTRCARVDLMSDTTPLRHLLEPGEYRVQWTIPSRERGEITLEEGLVRGHLLNGQWSCR